MIGLGLRANLFEAAHRPGRGSVIAALCDLDITKTVPWAARAPEAKVTTRYQDLLDDPTIDGVIVATPDFTHLEIVGACLEAGKATFAEKPLAISIAACDALLATAMRTGSRLYVGHNMRHFSMVRIMKRLIDERAIGEVKAVWCRHFVGHGGDFYFKDWHAERANVTSLLLQKGAHDLDVIHWLAGGVGRRVHGIGGLQVYGGIADRFGGEGLPPHWFDPKRNWPPLTNTGMHRSIDVEDLSMIQMVLDNGVMASYEECHFSPDYWRNYTVIGTEGRIENFGDTTGKVCLYRGRTGYTAKAAEVHRFRATPGGHGGADERIMAEFVRFARVGGITDTSPIGAREAVAVGCAGAESIRSRGIPIDIAPPDPVVAAYFAAGQSR